MPDDPRQWKRYCRVYVSKNGQNEEFLDLSQFNVSFKISQRCVGKPSTAVVMITNLAKSSADKIDIDYNTIAKQKGLRLIIDAGYEGNHGIIFDGDLWFKTTGRTSETDTYLKLIAARGDRAYQYSFTNVTMSRGATQAQIYQRLTEDMKPFGITDAPVPKYLLKQTLPRGKTVFMHTHKALDAFGKVNNLNWGFGDNSIITTMYQPVKYTDQEVVVLNSATGLIGRPELTQTGIECKCLLNPKIGYGTIFQIDNASLQRGEIDTSYLADYNKNQAVSDYHVAADGLYVTYSCEIVGETRGQNWYSDLKGTALNGKKPTDPTYTTTMS